MVRGEPFYVGRYEMVKESTITTSSQLANPVGVKPKLKGALTSAMMIQFHIKISMASR
jgi:hypothetical protein